MDTPTDPYAELHPALTAALIDAWHLLPHTTGVGTDETFRNLYYLIDYLADAVKLAFPAIPCKSGCSQCCVDYGLPRTTAIEFAAIHRFVRTQMPAEIWAQVLAATRRDYGNQLENLRLERARIQRPHTDESVPDLPVPPFTCLQCPFLIDGGCSIYPVRPAVCRAFGSFSVRIRERQQAFTCRMAADTLQVALKADNIDNLALPLWGRFEERLYALNDPIGDVASLPLWLLAHLDGDQLTAEVDPRPDFDRLASHAAD